MPAAHSEKMWQESADLDFEDEKLLRPTPEAVAELKRLTTDEATLLQHGIALAQTTMEYCIGDTISAARQAVMEAAQAIKGPHYKVHIDVAKSFVPRGAEGWFWGHSVDVEVWSELFHCLQPMLELRVTDTGLVLWRVRGEVIKDGFEVVKPALQP